MTIEEKNKELAMYIEKYQGKTIKCKYNDDEYEVYFVGVFTNALDDNDQYTLCCINDSSSNKELRVTPYWIDKYFDAL